MTRDSRATFFEFFAGGGFARAGLSGEFACTFANDNDGTKARAYRSAYGAGELLVADIATLSPRDLPGAASLAWASFPCQDLSLAGARAGLAGPRSGLFWHFHRLITALDAEARAPEVIALENVCGLLTSRGGTDFTAICTALSGLGYRVGALEIDAALFTPQSRPRLFIVAAKTGEARMRLAHEPDAVFHSPAIRAAAARLPEEARAHWAWWRLPAPPARNTRLADILDDPPIGAPWRQPEETARLLSLMSPLQQARIEALRRSGAMHVGAVFRRVRIEAGARVQRAEARFDGLAGCLRTPAGGSSRQALLFIEGEASRSRLLSPREAARLMGAPDDYPLPEGQTAALHLLGDGVCAPAVRWLSRHLLAPLCARPKSELETAP